MKFTLPNPNSLTERDFMRKINYMAHRTRHQADAGYIRRAKPGGSFYPRFHAYAELVDGQVEIDLHFDWRRPMHVKEARCSDNTGDVVEKEVARIKALVLKMSTNSKPQAQNTSQKKGFWGKLFA